jgi:hypothetical protein
MDKARTVRECGCTTTRPVAEEIAGEIPIACDLTVFTPEERAEHLERTRKVFSAIGHLTEDVDGFTLTFTAARELRDDVGRWIEGEQRCCPFFVFDVTGDRGDDSFAVQISGPDGAKEILRSIFEAPAPSAPWPGTPGSAGSRP